MRSSAPYTCVMLRGSYCGKGHNPTFASLSYAVTTNTKYLRLRRPPSPQLADILSIDILFTDIPSTDILFADILSIDILFIDILSTN